MGFSDISDFLGLFIQNLALLLKSAKIQWTGGLATLQDVASVISLQSTIIEGVNLDVRIRYLAVVIVLPFLVSLFVLVALKPAEFIASVLLIMLGAGLIVVGVWLMFYVNGVPGWFLPIPSGYSDTLTQTAASLLAAGAAVLLVNLLVTLLVSLLNRMKQASEKREVEAFARASSRTAADEIDDVTNTADGGKQGLLRSLISKIRSFRKIREARDKIDIEALKRNQTQYYSRVLDVEVHLDESLLLPQEDAGPSQLQEYKIGSPTKNRRKSNNANVDIIRRLEASRLDAEAYGQRLLDSARIKVSKAQLHDFKLRDLEETAFDSDQSSRFFIILFLIFATGIVVSLVLFLQLPARNVEIGGIVFGAFVAFGLLYTAIAWIYTILSAVPRVRRLLNRSRNLMLDIGLKLSLVLIFIMYTPFASYLMQFFVLYPIEAKPGQMLFSDSAMLYNLWQDAQYTVNEYLPGGFDELAMSPLANPYEYSATLDAVINCTFHANNMCNITQTLCPGATEYRMGSQQSLAVNDVVFFFPVNILLVFVFIIGLPLVAAFSTFRAARILRNMNVEPLMYSKLPASLQLAEHKKKKKNQKKAPKKKSPAQAPEDIENQQADEPRIVIEGGEGGDAGEPPASPTGHHHEVMQSFDVYGKAFHSPPSSNVLINQAAKARDWREELRFLTKEATDFEAEQAEKDAMQQRELQDAIAQGGDDASENHSDDEEGESGKDHEKSVVADHGMAVHNTSVMPLEIELRDLRLDVADEAAKRAKQEEKKSKKDAKLSKRKERQQRKKDNHERWLIRIGLASSPIVTLFSSYFEFHKFFKIFTLAFKIILVTINMVLINMDFASMPTVGALHLGMFLVLILTRPYRLTSSWIIITSLSLLNSINSFYLYLNFKLGAGVVPDALNIIFLVLNGIAGLLSFVFIIQAIIIDMRIKAKFTKRRARLIKYAHQKPTNKYNIDFQMLKQMMRNHREVNLKLTQFANTTIVNVFVAVGAVAFISFLLLVNGFVIQVLRSPQYVGEQSWRSEVDSRVTAATLRHNSTQACLEQTRYYFAGYSSWEEMTANCCCQDASDEANLYMPTLYSYLGLGDVPKPTQYISKLYRERWTCLNGNQQVRLRSYPINNSTAANSFAARGLCSRQWNSGWSLQVRCDDMFQGTLLPLSYSLLNIPEEYSAVVLLTNLDDVVQTGAAVDWGSIIFSSQQMTDDVQYAFATYFQKRDGFW